MVSEHLPDPTGVPISQVLLYIHQSEFQYCEFEKIYEWIQPIMRTPYDPLPYI
jgi:hypothetical protein